MKLYNYNKSNIYTKTTDAIESPLEKGVYLVPNYATLVPIPGYDESNQYLVFNGSSWNIIDIIPESIPEYNLDKDKQLKINQVKINYNKVLNNALTISLSGDKNFNIDITEKAQSDWNKLLTIGNLDNSIIFSIRDADNNTVELSYNELVQMTIQIFSYVQSKWSIRCSIIDSILDSNVDSKEKLDIIDLTI